MNLITIFMLFPLLSLNIAIAKGSGIRLNVDLLAGKAHEACKKLQAGDTIRWNFRASSPVDFNLHHHVENEVFMPVKKLAIKADKGERGIDQTNDWCLMWTASKEQNAKISGTWSTKKAPTTFKKTPN